MIYFILIGILIAVIMKRNPARVLTVQFRAPFWMIGALAAQIFLAYLASRKNMHYPLVLDLTFAVMLVSLYLNRGLGGVWWIFGGTLLNTAALMLHGGTMPVSETAMQLAGLTDLSFDADSRHHLMSSTAFWWLGDILPILTPVGTNYVFSPGDVLVAVGLISFIVQNSKRGDVP